MASSCITGAWTVVSTLFSPLPSDTSPVQWRGGGCREGTLLLPGRGGIPVSPQWFPLTSWGFGAFITIQWGWKSQLPAERSLKTPLCSPVRTGASIPHWAFATMGRRGGTAVSMVLGWSRAVVIWQVFYLARLPLSWSFGRRAGFCWNFFFSCLKSLVFLGCQLH